MLLKNKYIGTPYQISFKMRPGDGQGKNAYLNRQPYFQKMERFLYSVNKEDLRL